MAISIREKILQSIMAKLSDWLTSKDFNLNCGTNVYRAKHKHEIEDAPFVVLWPLPESSEKVYGQYSNTMKIRLEAATAYGSENMSEVSEKILADMKEIMGGKVGEITDGYGDDVTYTGGGTDDYPDSQSLYVGAYTDWQIKYMEKIGNPYKQDKEI